MSQQPGIETTQDVYVQAGPWKYHWDSNWAKLPDEIQTGNCHGVCVDRQGRVIVFNQSRHAILIFDSAGNYIGTWDMFPSDRFIGAHGLTLVDEIDGQQYLWLTDEKSGEVGKFTLDGQKVQDIHRPDHPAYEEKPFKPTWVATSPKDGTIYVADGYGAHLVHRYDRDGNYVDSFDGSTGAGRFACPHGIWIGIREQVGLSDDAMVYITDRGNSRVQIFDLDMGFVKQYEQKHPCSFARLGETMMVPDLHGSVFLRDASDNVIGQLGTNPGVENMQGYPKLPKDQIVEGKFVAPHGSTFDPAGNIYVVEWIPSGRITKLTRMPS